MRKLTEKEIAILEEQGCSAEDWMNVMVDEYDFRASEVRNVFFYGTIEIGGMSGTLEVSEGFTRRCGICNATLRNVSIGNDCLIENVVGYIGGYDIGDRTYILNVGVISTQGEPTFGQGQVVSVLNEGGDGNVVIYDKLTAQTASLMLEHKCVRDLVEHELAARRPMERGVIGQGVRIVGLRDMQNTLVGDACEIQNASRIVETTILSRDDASTFIGADVVLDECVVAEGSTVSDGAKAYHSYIGQSVHMGRGYSSESSLFFANSHLENGEACAAFCGPFTCTHHKSTLLIGGQFSFYNAGSGTNQSNHAYKMGPIHYGVLQRGSKTASGSHILWPAQIGSFSMVMGKLTQHPNLLQLPFSYVIADGGGKTYVVPGINLRTVGTWRDVGKWPKRDKRSRSARRDVINFAFPNPFIIQNVIEGKKILQSLLRTHANEDELQYEGCVIRRSHAVNGIRYYDLALRLFVYEVFNQDASADDASGRGTWLDLNGLLAPQADIDRIVADVETGDISSTDELLMVLRDVDAEYKTNAAGYLNGVLQQESDNMFVDNDYWMKEAEDAHEQWIDMVRQDAEHEYQLGDVDEDFLRKFLKTIEQ
ncbi:MAG: DUF4954 family protein [Bacteroidales bacterium]|nr:DUF4954 family protein [Bacteroidales bacterium]